MSRTSVTPYINVARITKTHGKYGETVVTPIDGLPFCLTEGMQVCLTPPMLHGERTFSIGSVRGNGPWYVRFRGVSDLDAAGSLIGKTVLARRADVPAAVKTWQAIDAVGSDLIDNEHGLIGRIREICQLPANDVWIVDGGPYGEILVPVIDDIIQSFPTSDDPSVRVRLLPGILPEA